MGEVRTTVRVTNIPLTAIAKELFDFLELSIGKNSVFAVKISTVHPNWKSKGVGTVQFETVEAATTACRLSINGRLEFQCTRLQITPSIDQILVRPIEPQNQVQGGVLHVGFLIEEDRMSVLESWTGVKAEIMPEREKIWFSVSDGDEWFKMEIQFGDVFASFGCVLNGGKSNALLLKLKYAPRIYRKLFGPTLTSNFSSDRYNICKEDYEFLWVRTTDFSASKSIGQSTYFCWELPEGLLPSKILSSFPHSEELGHLTLEQGKPFFPRSNIVPVVNCPSDPNFSYEILFQLNSLVHAQKLCGTAVNADFFNILSGLPDTAMMILRKLHKLKSTCYDPVQFIKNQLNLMNRKQKRPLSSRGSMLQDENLMSCHRVLITPSKVYFMGPELEKSNYVVKHYAPYASDFLRVSFVEEDWNKLPSDAITTRTESGIYSEPYRTAIYDRILSILRDGISVGAKRFEFLAFSASQLRSNAVWMFASNDSVSAESIREWMGQFNKIRSVSKCAARMGQLFSSSKQTVNVPAHDVQVGEDIEVIIDGIKYCFSDGIGKISLSFARKVAEMCGLDHIPSAFQIRYGGYKGVIAVDFHIFRKLFLRPSMLKFHSENTMLSVTKCSEYMPCYLNREIVSLLSTLGIKDEVFETMQNEQMGLLDEMLMNKEVALNVLEGMGGDDTKTIMVKMLLQGYEPSIEPYLLMMLKAHREFQLSDIRSKCRIFVQKGRVLMGCLDETGTLSYGQVYVRVTMTKAELQYGDQIFLKKINETTSVVVGKVVVTKNPCLHPGDIRVLQAIYVPALEEMGFTDCIVFPKHGDRPHPNECSGGDLDGDLYFVCWDENLIPLETDTPMDYFERRARIMDHEVTLEEIQKFFVDYMINDTLGAISTAHLVHADREPGKARSPKCLQLATLHSMAVDFAKTGAPAEMPRILKPKEYPDFLERTDRPAYISTNVLGKLYRATIERTGKQNSNAVWSNTAAHSVYDYDLEVDGFEAFLDVAASHKELYIEKLSTLMNYYGVESEDEILTGNLRNKSGYLNRDKKRYGEMKERIVEAVKFLRKEAKGWFKSECKEHEYPKMASAWYHVTYHPNYCSDINFLSFPWVMDDVLLSIKSIRRARRRDSTVTPLGCDKS